LAEHRQPRLAVDCIIRHEGRVVVVRRRNPPRGWALPGGFVECGEAVEAAVRREMLEETGVELANLAQFRVYSDPARDPRGHCVSVVFTADAVGTPRAGGDAAELRLIEPGRATEAGLVFDHTKILADYSASISH
jgi:ADP-ribose pyrophosphatase YjhB (NUDIX family)